MSTFGDDNERLDNLLIFGAYGTNEELSGCMPIAGAILFLVTVIGFICWLSSSC